MFGDVRRFIVADDVFSRYTVLIDLDESVTSVYCAECEEWVGQWPDERVSGTREEFSELIVETHRNQVLGHPVEIADITETFKCPKDK